LRKLKKGQNLKLIQEISDFKTNLTKDLSLDELKNEYQNVLSSFENFVLATIEKDKTSNKVLELILDSSTKISKEKNSNILLSLLADLGKDLVLSDRCTIWLIDEENGVFWTKIAHGITDIKIPLDTGIIGEVYMNQKSQIVNDPYTHPKFNKEVDVKTQYRTYSIAAVPIFDNNDKMIGVFQAINKLNETRKFTKDDVRYLNIAVSYASKILDTDHLSAENKYHIAEQKKASKKQKDMLVNQISTSEEFETLVFYKASDILSGDSYSIYKTSDGGILFYVLDAMGHGVVPSLTSFSVASVVKRALDNKMSFEELADELARGLEYILSDMEQLSCSFFYLNPKTNILKYFNAGMYPTVLKNNGKISELKANNIPFMDFYSPIKIDKIELNKFEAILVFTDGLVEDSHYSIEKDELYELINRDFLQNRLDVLVEKTLEDDLTVVLIENKEFKNDKSN
jgi:serine phosphatase RsbU (regulator of sigma subunit)